MELTQEQIDAIEAMLVEELAQVNRASWHFDDITLRARSESIRGKVEQILQ